MKKNILIILFILAAYSLFSQGEVADVWIEPVNYNPGSHTYFSVDVYVNSGDYDIAAMGVTFTFDADLFEVDTSSGEKDGVTVWLPDPDHGSFSVNPNNPGKLRVVFFTTTAFPAGSRVHVMTLYFYALANAIFDTTIDVDNLISPDVEDILPENMVFEYGQVTTNQADSSEWHTVNLQNDYADPIIIMGPPSYNGEDPSVIRVDNVTPTSFQFQIDEWNYLNGKHAIETIGYIVVEAGAYRINGLVWTAGKINNVDHEWKSQLTSSASYDGSQSVFAQCVTTNGGAAVTTRIRNIEYYGFEVKLQEEEGEDGTHNPETVHYLVLTKNAGSVTVDDLTCYSNQKKIDDTMSNVLTTNHPNPIVLAQILTYEGGNTAALRYELSSTGVSMKVEEEQSADNETDHNPESVGYLIMEP
ncbi:MAG: hypothetical protein JXJ04_22070 [Spirochaetales bacterium]|nr:hypothetical protein [Spirochaetales bacterium]